MDDLTIGSYCIELLTPWDEEDEANFYFDLDSDESDELYETYSTAVGDDEVNSDMYWDSNENDKKCQYSCRQCRC